MRRFVMAVGAVLLAACGTKPAPAPPPPPAAPPAPAPINMADVAGKWAMETTAQGSDSVLVKYTIEAKADTAGWEINFPGRKPVPAHVVASGDSLIVDAGPYESVLKKGIQVTTHTVYRMTGGKLDGATMAHYSNIKTADSVRALHSSGTKMP